MTINTNGEGVACCSCGAELQVVCTGGCPEPDVVFKSELAAMRKPHAHERPQFKEGPPKICNWLSGCDQPVAPRLPGHGRFPKKGPKHLEIIRGYERNRHAKRAATNGATA